MKLPDRIASERGLKALQFVGRILFALLVGLYLFRAGPVIVGLDLPNWTIWCVLTVFVLLHAILLFRIRSAANLPSALLDLIGIALVALVDPGTPPPTLVLLLIATLSAGLVHGLRRLLYALLGSIVVVAVVLPARLASGGDTLAAGTIFLVAVLLVCVIYFMLMVYRNRVLARHAREATWRDPDTGLISHTAMINTAGWLLPLHDRLSSRMTLIQVRPEYSNELKRLADRISTRLRRSDIAARYDDQTLTLLLPDTSVSEAEWLLNELRSQQPALTAAVLELSDPEHSLESVLYHIRATLDRARDDGAHWLVHAGPPGH